jgi:two-component system alkaline phosphatase synthesis response regulator PhoP
MKKKVLVVDDESDILDLMTYNLRGEGYDVVTARDGPAALQQASLHPDLIILDVMMPGLDGYEVCRRLKNNPSTASIPVVFLTARSAEVDEVHGLEIGADDYVQKPISPRKLLARVRAVFRRGEAQEGAANPILTSKNLEINRSSFTVKVKGREVFFPRKEFELLALLVSNRGRVFSREMLLDQVWGGHVVVVDRTIDVHVSRIREKLGDEAGVIETVKGVGYRFREQ